MAAAAAADYDGVRTGRIEGDFGGGRTEFRFYEKKGLITVKVGSDGRVPAIKRRSRKKRFCEDTLTAIRRKLPEYYPGCRIDRVIDDDPEPMDVEPPEPPPPEPPPEQPPPKRQRRPPPVVYDPQLPDHRRTGRRHGRVHNQTLAEVQVLRKQRDDIIKMIRSNDRPAAQVVQGILFELLGRENDSDSESSDEEETPSPEELDQAPAPRRREAARVRAGRELRQLIREINRLRRAGKMKEAAAASDRLETEGAIADAKKRAGDSLITRRAKEIQDQVFGMGDLETTRRIVEAFLDSPEMKAVLPAHLQQTSKDAETARLMLEQGKRFVKRLMKAKGRRNDLERNVLLGAVAALCPVDLFDMKRGRSFMRAMGTTWAVTSQAVKARQEAEDRGKGWKRVDTKGHYDKLDIAPMVRFWHESADASSYDNDNKRHANVFLGPHPETKEEMYEKHPLRYQNGTNEQVHEAFTRSSYAQQCKEISAKTTGKEGIIPGLTSLINTRCACIKKRGVGECDCSICKTIHHNLQRYHRQLGEWLRRAGVDATGDGAECECGGACVKWLKATSSLAELQAFLYCPAEHLADYDIGDVKFKIIPKLCAEQKCKHCVPDRNYDPSRACGVERRTAPLKKCPIVYGNDRCEWYTWAPRLSGNNKETGEPHMQAEWVPTWGPRRGFLDFYTEELVPYASHKWREDWCRQTMKRIERFRPRTTATKHSDFAAILPIVREYLGTCGRRDYLNNCVSILGWGTRDVEVMRPVTHRSRTLEPKTVPQQHVECFFGFSGPGYKPDTRYYTAQYEDIVSFLKTGKVLYGEWFLNKQRIAGGDRSEQLPEGFTERPETPPDFPELDEIIEELDGCAAQFANAQQYHQVATGLMRRGVRRKQLKLVENHGKNVCDGYSNIPRHCMETTIKNGTPLRPGSREAVVHFAREHPEPKHPKASKDDWWALERIFYGYYGHEVIKRVDLPDAKAFKGTRKMHEFVGLSTDSNLLDGAVPLYAREDGCYCVPCSTNDWEDCKFRDRLGSKMRKFSTKAVKATAAGVRTQQQALEDWADVVHEQELLAVRCNDPKYDDPFWLAKPTGPAFAATEDFTHTNDDIEEGWTILPIKWFDRRPDNTYTLLPRLHYLNVNATVRVPGLKWASKAQGRFTLSSEDYETIKNNI